MTDKLLTKLSHFSKSSWDKTIFLFKARYTSQTKGVAMGSRISGTIAETFLQQLEKAHIKHLIDTKNLIFYTRYVDYILIVYDSTHITPERILQYTNTIHSNIQLNPAQETNGNICFMDLSITRKPTCLEIGIYRKPTSTDTTINFLSNHPLEHKLAAYQFLIRRMLILPLREEQRQEEWKYILQTSYNNNLPVNLLIRQKQRIQRRTTQPKTPTTTGTDTRWETFTYTCPKIRKITNLFKHTNVKIAFKCNNTISQLAKLAKNTSPHPP